MYNKNCNYRFGLKNLKQKVYLAEQCYIVFTVFYTFQMTYGKLMETKISEERKVF